MVKADHMGTGSYLDSLGELFKTPSTRLHPKPIKPEPLAMRPRYQ